MKTIALLSLLVCITSVAIADESKALQVTEGEYYIVAKDLGIGNDLYLSLAEAKHAVIPGLKTLAWAALTALTAALAVSVIAGVLQAELWIVMLAGDEALEFLLVPLFLGIVTFTQAQKIPTGKTLVLSKSPAATWRVSKSDFEDHQDAFELASSWDKAPKRKGRTIALSSKSKLYLSKKHAVPFVALEAPGFENSIYLQVMGVIESDNKFLFLSPKKKGWLQKETKFQTVLDGTKKSLWELRSVSKGI